MQTLPLLLPDTPGSLLIIFALSSWVPVYFSFKYPKSVILFKWTGLGLLKLPCLFCFLPPQPKSYISLFPFEAKHPQQQQSQQNNNHNILPVLELPEYSAEPSVNQAQFVSSSVNWLKEIPNEDTGAVDEWLLAIF